MKRLINHLFLAALVLSTSSFAQTKSADGGLLSLGELSAKISSGDLDNVINLSKIVPPAGGGGGNLDLIMFKALQDVMKTQDASKRFYVVPDPFFINLVGRINTTSVEPIMSNSVHFVADSLVINEGTVLLEALHENGYNIYFMGSSQFTALKDPAKYVRKVTLD